jgi:hypothetical protein
MNSGRDDRSAGRSSGDWSGKVLPWLLAAALLLAIFVGLRSIGRAQTGELGRDAMPPANPGLVAAPELERDRLRVRECRDARGTTVYTATECAADAPVTEVETVPIELAPPR